MQVEYIALIYFPLIPILVFGTIACFMKNKDAAYVAMLVTVALSFLEVFAVMLVSSIDEYNEATVAMLKMQASSLGIMVIWFMAMHFVVRPVIAFVIRAFERRYGLRSS
jgi:hypothetical protein